MLKNNKGKGETPDWSEHPLLEYDGTTVSEFKLLQIILGFAPNRRALTEEELDKKVEQKVTKQHITGVAKQMVRARQDAQYEQVFGGGKLFLMRLSFFLIVIIGLMASTSFAINFPILSFLPSADATVLLLIGFTVFTFLLFTGITWIHTVAVPAGQKKHGKPAVTWLEYLAYRMSELVWKFVFLCIAIFVFFRPMFHDVSLATKNTTMYHTFGSDLLSKSHDRHELDEEVYGPSNPFLCEYVGHFKAQEILLPGGKLVSYALLLFFLGYSALSFFHYEFGKGAVFLCFAFLIFFVIGDVYIPSMLGIHAKNLIYYIFGACLIFVWWGYYKFIHQSKEWVPHEKCELKGHSLKRQESELRFDGIAGHSRNYSIAELNAMDKLAEEDRNRQNAEAERTRNIPRELNRPSIKTQELDKKRRENDTKEGPWEKYYAEKEKRNKQ